MVRASAVCPRNPSTRGPSQGGIPLLARYLSALRGAQAVGKARRRCLGDRSADARVQCLHQNRPGGEQLVAPVLPAVGARRLDAALERDAQLLEPIGHPAGAHCAAEFEEGALDGRVQRIGSHVVVGARHAAARREVDGLARQLLGVNGDLPGAVRDQKDKDEKQHAEHRSGQSLGDMFRHVGYEDDEGGADEIGRAHV